MKIVNSAFLLIIILFLPGCTAVKSSVHFNKGTQCLEDGNIQEARIHLEKACELEPRLSRYHNNLACVYIKLGEIKKAWDQSRQAAYLDTRNEEAVFTFKSLLELLTSSYNIKNGSTREEVEIAFGEPDMIIDGSEKILRYGICFLLFKEEKLIGKSMMFAGGENTWSLPLFEPF